MKDTNKIEERRKAIKDGLINSAEERFKKSPTPTVEELESPTTPFSSAQSEAEPKSPALVDSFERNGLSVGGPSGRTRVRPKVEGVVNEERISKRRGIYKIWNNKPIKNVGEGTNTYDTKK